MRYLHAFLPLLLFICGPVFSQVQLSPSTYTIDNHSGYRVAKIGNFNVADTTWLSQQNSLVTLSSRGGDIWWNSDNFKYLYVQVPDDAAIAMTIKTESLNHTDDWAKFGLMTRDSLNPNAKSLFWAVRPAAGSFVQYRTAIGVNTEGAWRGHLPVTELTPTEFALKRAVGNLKAPAWMRLVKRGPDFEFYVSEDGVCWVKRHERNIPELATTGFFGVALSSGSSSFNAVSTFRSLKISGVPTDMNFECLRATADKWVKPTNWIVPTGEADPYVEWRYVEANPNASIQPVACPGGNVGGANNRQEGPSDPSCLNVSAPIPWTQSNFNDNGWNSGYMGFGRSNHPEINENSSWDTGNLWLRKEFFLSSQADINNLVLWGKWSQGISVYLNGVLAYSSYGYTPDYGYRSFKAGARSGLVIGRNVVAVRIKAQDWSSNGGVFTSQPNYFGFVDVGLALSEKIANPQFLAGTPPANDEIARMANGVKDLLALHGVPGATFAIGENDQILGSWTYGSRTPILGVPMPSDAILRLASNDKPITRSIIVALIERDKFKPNGLKPTSKYFAFLNDPAGLNLGIQPPGIDAGSGMNDVTIDDLMQHRAGIPEVARGENLDAMALSMGISTLQWTPQHLVRWTYGLNRITSSYSSNGHFLLRFLAVKMLEAEGKTLETFLANDMGLPGIVISRKDWNARGPKGAGYVVRDFSHTHVWLDDLYSLSASSEAYLRYSFSYFPFYDLVGNSYVGRHSQHNGEMDAVVSKYRVKTRLGNQRTWILNTTKADLSLREITEYIDNLEDKTECDWGRFSNPTIGPDYFFMKNLWKPDQYFSLTGTSFRSRPFATRPPPSDLWYFEQATAGKYYIRTGGNYLYIDQNQNFALKMGTSGSADSSRWYVEPVFPGDPVSGVYRIKNVAYPGKYINNQNQVTEDVNYPLYGVQASDIESGWLSSIWKFCKNS